MPHKAVAAFFKAVSQFFFPHRCAHCRRDIPHGDTDTLCAACTRALQTPGPLICQRCGRVLPDGGAHCPACRGSKAAAYKCKLIRSAFCFTGPARSAVYTLKYRKHAAAARFMGAQMAREIRKYPELCAVNCIIPVPLVARRNKARGFNQSELLARELAAHLHLPADSTALLRVRDTGSQTRLNRAERLQNVRGAFTCTAPERIRGKTVLLVDDVCTTGATLEACATALRAAGAKRVVGFTYARE